MRIRPKDAKVIAATTFVNDSLISWLLGTVLILEHL